MWGIPDHLLAVGKDSEAIAYVVDQLIDPQDFVAKLEELYTRPETESIDIISVQGWPCLRELLADRSSSKEGHRPSLELP